MVEKDTLDKKNESVSLSAQVRERFEAAAAGRQDRQDAWVRAYRDYRGVSARDEKLKDSDLANYYIPEIFTAVETEMPRYCGDFMNQKKRFVSVEPANGSSEIDQAKAEAVEDLIAFDFYKDNLDLKLYQLYRSTLIFGTGVGRVYYDYRTKQRKEWTIKTDEWGRPYYDVEEKEKVIHDGPSFQPIPVFDFYPDPAAVSMAGLPDLTQCRFTTQRKLLTASQIKELFDIKYYNKYYAIYKLPDEGSGQLNSGMSEVMDISGLSNEARGLPGKFEVLEYFEDDREIITIEDIVVHDGPARYWHGKKPFVMMQYIPIDFTLWGMGIPESVKDLQTILNDLSNERLNILRRNGQGAFFYQEGTLKKKDLINLRSGGGIPVKGDPSSAVIPARFGIIPPNSYNEDEKIKQAIQNATGSHDVIRGASKTSGPKQTATEIMARTDQAQTLFTMRFKVMARQGVKQIAEHFIELERQYMDEVKNVKVLGQDGEFNEVTHEVLKGDFDFVVSVDPEGVQKQQKRKDLLTFMDITAQPRFIEKVDSDAILEEVCESFDLDRDRFILPPKPPMPPQGQPMPGMPEGEMINEQPLDAGAGIPPGPGPGNNIDAGLAIPGGIPGEHGSDLDGILDLLLGANGIQPGPDIGNQGAPIPY